MNRATPTRRTTLTLIASIALATLSLACTCSPCSLLTGLLEGVTPSQPQFETSAGAIEIVGVESADSFPPGCSSGPACSHAKEGYQVLIIWLKRANGGNIREVGDELFSETLPHLTGDEAISVTDADGTTSSLAITHIDDDDNRFALVFAVRDTGRDFTFTWLDNLPIALEQPIVQP